MDVQIKVEVATASAAAIEPVAVVPVICIFHEVAPSLVATSPWSVISVNGNSMHAIPGPVLSVSNLKESEELAWAA